MLHGDGLRKFPQHPLLKVLKPLVVVAAADKLLVLQEEIQQGSDHVAGCCLEPQASSQLQALVGLIGKSRVKTSSSIHASYENTFASTPSFTKYCKDMLLSLKVIFFILQKRACGSQTMHSLPWIPSFPAVRATDEFTVFPRCLLPPAFCCLLQQQRQLTGWRSKNSTACFQRRWCGFEFGGEINMIVVLRQKCNCFMATPSICRCYCGNSFEQPCESWKVVVLLLTLTNSNK